MGPGIELEAPARRPRFPFGFGRAGDESWRLRFDFGAIAALERDAGGRPFVELAGLALAEEPGEPAFLFGALLRAGLAAARPGVTMADVRHLEREVGRPRLSELLRRAFAEAMGRGDPEDPEPGEPEPVDVDKFLTAWCEAGLRPKDFWLTTPGEYRPAIAGTRARDVRTHNERMTAAYWAGRIGREKRMTPLKDLLISADGKSRSRRARTPDQQKAALDMFVVASGGELGEPGKKKPRRRKKAAAAPPPAEG